jgi:hexulose-6-phosphate isomerase
MNRFGAMQGRLVPPEGGRLQSFPREGWRDEFERASSAGLDYIEWIYDGYGADVNPLLTPAGRREMIARCNAAGVKIVALCADYYMERPLLPNADARDDLRRLLPMCREVGVERVVLPFVDNSALSDNQTGCAIDFLNQAAVWARELGIELHLETSLPPGRFAALLAELPADTVKVNYDSGNSASLGYPPADEFAALGSRIGSVHIKDRVLGGGTVPLATGSADFASLFTELRRIQYARDFTLQVARGEPGDEVAWARRNVDFVRRHWPDGGAA